MRGKKLVRDLLRRLRYSLPEGTLPAFRLATRRHPQTPKMLEPEMREAPALRKMVPAK